MSKKTPTVVACPTCNRAVEWSEKSRWRPFCSERCRLIDLGEWLQESHRIPGEEQSPQALPESENDY